MGKLIDLVGGLFELLRLGIVTRFRFRGAYWTWRLHTAFGRGYPASRMELVRSVVRYGVWVRQMRRAASR